MNKKRNLFLAFCALAILIITACENPLLPPKKSGPDGGQELPAPKTPVVNITAEIRGSNVTLTATATVGDGGKLSYQWHSNGANSNSGGSAIPGATTASYELSAPEGTTYYYVKATNSLNGKTASAVSGTIEVTVSGGDIEEVIVADSVKTPAVSVYSSVSGSIVTLTAAASSSDGGTVTLQWYRNTVGNRNGTAIPGETGSVYSPPVSSPGTTYYYVRATNTLNGQSASVLSNIVRVTVPSEEGGGGPPQTDNTSAEAPSVSITASVSGSSVTLTAAASASGGGTISYQWYSNTMNSNTGGSILLGETGTTYSPPTASAGTAYYYVIATNTLNDQTASTASNIVGVTVPQGGGQPEVDVEVVTPVVAASASPSPGPYVRGANVMLSANYSPPSDGGVISIQWYRNTTDSTTGGTAILGATGLIYTAPTNAYGTVYYYVRATNTLKGKTASAFSNTVEITVSQIEIEGAAVSVTVPIKDTAPVFAAIKLDVGSYACGPVVWTKNDSAFSGLFEGSTVYKASVTLTANADYVFAANFMGSINNNPSTFVTRNSNTSVTLSLTFPKTLGKDVYSVAVNSQPTKLIGYEHGDPLDLTGLQITITYTDGTTNSGLFLELAEEEAISSSPEHGEKLRILQSGQRILIDAGGKTAQTQAISVGRKGLTITRVSHTKVYNANTTATGTITVTAWDGVNDEFGDRVTGITGVTGAYVSADVGSAMNISEITGTGAIAGLEASYYYVAASANVPVTGGITPFTPTAPGTWPSIVGGTSVPYGTHLSDLTLTTTSGNARGVSNVNVPGTYAWTNPNVFVGNAGNQTHNVTFTPTDNPNYSTANYNITITVTALPLTVMVTPSITTLSPVDTTEILSVTISGMTTVSGVPNNTTTVNLSNLGTYPYLSISNNANITTDGTREITLTYNGTTAVTSPDLPIMALTITGVNYTLTNSPTVTLTVIDGQDAARAIPVTQNNVNAFNTYARTANGLTRHYKLVEDITLTAPEAGGSNWTPIGGNTVGSRFSGSFDGQDHKISNLIMIISTQYIGMFGGATGVIKNLGLVGVNITGGSSGTGGVAGLINGGTIKNCYSTGSISGYSDTGGVVGAVDGNATIESCYSTASLTTEDYAVGGVAGAVYGGTIKNCYSTGSISSDNYASAGGVVGALEGNVTIEYCYSTGSINNSSGSITGGVVGVIANFSGTNVIIRRCVAYNSYILSTTSPNGIGRVIGSVGGNIIATLTYNYGYNMAMTYNAGTYTPTSNVNGKDGADFANPTSQVSWTDTINGPGWTFDASSAWQWDGSLQRPTLRGFPAGAPR